MGVGVLIQVNNDPTLKAISHWAFSAVAQSSTIVWEPLRLCELYTILGDTKILHCPDKNGVHPRCDRQNPEFVED